VIETITFYADNGDLQMAAYIALVFNNQLAAYHQATQEKKEEKKVIGPINPNQAPPQILPYEPFISRVLVSYLEMLKKLHL